MICKWKGHEAVIGKFSPKLLTSGEEVFVCSFVFLCEKFFKILVFRKEKDYKEYLFFDLLNFLCLGRIHNMVPILWATTIWLQMLARPVWELGPAPANVLLLELPLLKRSGALKKGAHEHLSSTMKQGLCHKESRNNRKSLLANGDTGNLEKCFLK